MVERIHTIRQTITRFCIDFVSNPYLCYTEHGQHALFYAMLYNALPTEQRFTTWQGNQVCVIQKEYPTAGGLGKSRRQHWDVAILQTPAESIVKGPRSYDYLKLAAVVEFGMNVTEQHLVDDMDRLCHPKANVEQGFEVHLYRLSQSRAPFSGRDWSPNSKRILTQKYVSELSNGGPAEIFYGMYDSTGQRKSGVWLIKQGEISLLE